MTVKFKKSGAGALYLGGKKLPLDEPVVLQKPEAALTFKHPDGTEQEVKLEVKPPSGYIGPVAKVSCGMGATINVGNYESLRVSVNVEMPCYPQEVEEVWVYVRDWCDQKMGDAINKAKGEDG